MDTKTKNEMESKVVRFIVVGSVVIAAFTFSVTAWEARKSQSTVESIEAKLELTPADVATIVEARMDRIERLLVLEKRWNELYGSNPQLKKPSWWTDGGEVKKK